MNQLDERRYYEEDDEIDLMELVHTMVTHKYLIIITTILITIFSLIGGQIYNKKKVNVESSVILHEINRVNIGEASKNFKIDGFNLEEIKEKKLSYKIVTSKENKDLLDKELTQVKEQYKAKLIENNILSIYSGRKDEVDLKKYLDSIILNIRNTDVILSLTEIKDKIMLSEKESLEELKERADFLNDELSFYKDIVLNYKLQNKELTFGVNQNTIKFLPETLNSEDISYTHYRELLGKYIDIRTELNLTNLKIKNFGKTSKEDINIADEIEKVNKIVSDLNLEKEEYIQKNIDNLISISPVKTVFSGKPIYLFLGVGVVLGGMLGVFLAFLKEFIKNYQDRYSK